MPQARLQTRERVRIAACYRVCQRWRLPIFTRLSKRPDIEFCLLHGADVEGTKLVSAPDDGSIHRVEMRTWSGRASTSGRHVALTISPEIIRRLRDFGPDVILLEGASNLPNNLLALSYASATGTPWIWWSLGAIRGRRYSFFGRVYRRVVADIERSASAVISYSRMGDDYFASLGIPSAKRWVATNVLDTSEVVARTAEAPALRARTRERLALGDRPVVLFCGELSMDKKVDRLPDVMRMVVERVPSALLLVVGDGEMMHELTRRVSAERLDSSVRLLGRQSTSVSDYMRAADVLLLPGLGGLVISEAMAHGLPVVCTDADGTGIDLVADTGSGIHIEESPESQVIERMSAAVIRILGSEHLRRSMGRAGLQAVRDRFNADSYVQTLVDCVTQVHRRNYAR